MKTNWNYYDDWKSAEFDCPVCKWHGLGSDLRGGNVFAECFDFRCPSCGDIILVFPFPTFEECHANWDKLSESERKSVEASERHYEEFNRRKLREPSQLPDIQEPSFTLIWEIEGRDSHLNNVIRHGDTVIFAEPACYESYDRFIEVAEILRRRYGTAIRDLVPTERSEFYLYGDRLSAPEIVKDERKRIFSTPAPDTASRSGTGTEGGISVNQGL